MQQTQLGFGVIGCGLQGDWHLKTYQAHPSVTLACICDINEELVRRQAEKYTMTEASWPDTCVYLDIHGLPRALGPDSIWHFADCMVTGTQPMVTLADGVKNTKIVQAIHDSAAQQQPVALA